MVLDYHFRSSGNGRTMEEIQPVCAAPSLHEHSFGYQPRTQYHESRCNVFLSEPFSAIWLSQHHITKKKLGVHHIANFLILYQTALCRSVNHCVLNAGTYWTSGCWTQHHITQGRGTGEWPARRPLRRAGGPYATANVCHSANRLWGPGAALAACSAHPGRPAGGCCTAVHARHVTTGSVPVDQLSLQSRTARAG